MRFEAYFDFKAFGDEAGDKDYMIEYCWITMHDESGEKIVGMEEFMDAGRCIYMIDKAMRFAQFQSQSGK